MFTSTNTNSFTHKLAPKEGFDVFGSDSDNDDGDAQCRSISSQAHTSTTFHAQIAGKSSLQEDSDAVRNDSGSGIEGYNWKHTTTQRPTTLNISTQSESLREVSKPILLQGMPAWHSSTAQPLQSRSCRYVSDIASVGGGRGFYASDDIEAGALIMSERPLLDWSVCRQHQGESERMDAVAVRELLVGTYSPSVSVSDTAALHMAIKTKLDQLAYLCPVTLNEEDVDPMVLLQFRTINSELVDELKNSVRRKYENSKLEIPECVQRLISSGSVRSNADTPNKHPSGDDALLRLLLALQFNGFASGLYLHLSIFNHSCLPNCTKLSGLHLPSDKPGEWGYSEIRAARNIKKGEELLISYLQPQEQSTGRRQQQLDAAFHFDCVCEWCTRNNDVLAASDTDSEEVVDEIDEVIDSMQVFEVERRLEDLEADCLEAFSDNRREFQLSQIANELLTLRESPIMSGMHSRHVVRVRFNLLLSNVLQNIMGTSSDPSSADTLMRACVDVLELQKLYLHPFDPRLAESLLRVSESANLLLVSHRDVMINQFRDLGIVNDSDAMEFIRRIDKEWGVINRANKTCQRSDPIVDVELLRVQSIDRVGM
eukprot:CFRG1843T1